MVNGEEKTDTKRVTQCASKGKVMLKKGDVIKLGRAMLRVRALRFGESEGKDEGAYQDGRMELKESRATVESTDACKVCYSEANEESNPLISICNCTGSLRFIHYNCLKLWLATKRYESKQSAISSYYFKSLECEICKSRYPCTFSLQLLDTVLANGKHYNLIDIDTPIEGNYILFETITQNKAYAKAIYVVRLDEENSQVKIGRGHDSDLRIDDISVSRVHALVKMTGEGYVLQDNGSKFGTLYLLPPGPHAIPASDNLSIQFGRTFIDLTVKESEIEEAAETCLAASEARPRTKYFAASQHSEPELTPADDKSPKQSLAQETPNTAKQNC